MANAGDEREVEFKFRVDGPESFEALAKAAASRPSPAVTQRNHFFDTAGRDLNREKYTLRLRDEAGRFFLTAKGPEQRSVAGTLTSKVEEEVALAKTEADALLSGEKSPLEMLDQRADPRFYDLLNAIRAIIAGNTLEHVGVFQNDRARLPVMLSVADEGVPVLFEMDRATFPSGQIHYEVEVEIKGVDEKGVERALHAFFRKANVAWRSGPSKAKRFFDAAAGKPI